MDLATQNHLTALRELLTYRLRELRAEIGAAEQARGPASAVPAHEVVDRKDEAAQRQELELAGAQEERDIDEMAEVEAALGRLDAGVYGDCVDCGEPIPVQRLLVQPAARRCAGCQAQHEAAVHRAGHG
jgi:RNA polymerase-binding transcription factor DksA